MSGKEYCCQGQNNEKIMFAELAFTQFTSPCLAFKFRPTFNSKFKTYRDARSELVYMEHYEVVPF